MKYLVLGNSAAGTFAVEEIRRRDPGGEITVLTADKTRPYSRCLTTYFLAGDIPEERLYIRPEDFADRLGLTVVYDAKVVSLAPERKQVATADGRVWPYDKLLIATGASAVQLDIPGAGLTGVYTLRNLADAVSLDAAARSGRGAVVIGGGLVSLKGAYALLKRGLAVTVVVSSRQILSQMLDATAAGLLQKQLADHGLQVRLGNDVTEICGDGLIQEVKLSDGSSMAADLVLVGKGVTPNTAPFAAAGIEVGRGIRVNQFLETNLPDVYAAGDVAETWDRVAGSYRVNAIWPNATTQGRIAGANMAGAREEYLGSIGMNSVDFFGLSAISAGVTKLPQAHLHRGPVQANDAGEGDKKLDWHVEEDLRYKPDGTPVYQRLLWQGSCLKGYVLLGDTARAGVLTALVREGRQVAAGNLLAAGRCWASLGKRQLTLI